MPVNNFNKTFNLDEYNLSNGIFVVEKEDDLYKLFIKFITDNDKCKDDIGLFDKAIIDNDAQTKPIALSFIDAYPDEIQQIFYKDIKNATVISRKIDSLFDSLFLKINSDIYVESTSSDQANTYNLEAPYYLMSSSLKKTPIQRVKIENFYFATRAALYKMSYENLVQKIANISIEDREETTVYDSLVNYFIHSFFNDNENNAINKVTRYKDKANIEECKKSDNSIFILKGELTKKWFSFQSISSEISSLLVKLKEIFENEKNADLKEFFFGGDNISNYLSSTKGTIPNARKIKEKFKLILFKYRKYNSLESGDNNHFIRALDKISSIESKLDDILDAYDSVFGYSGENKNIHVVIYVRRTGVINIGLAREINSDSKWENDNYSSLSNNKLLDEATKQSNKISNAMNGLCKLFNYVNLNKLFIKQCKNNASDSEIDINNIVIYGMPFDKLYFDKLYSDSKAPIKFKPTINLIESIYKKNNSFKAIYSRLTFNHNDYIESDDISALYYFDLFSYLVGFSHSYDEKFIYDFTKTKDLQDEHKNHLIDLANSRTTHIFYDDSMITYTIMDQSSQYLNQRKLVGECKANVQFYKASSHKHRLYSLWEFSSLCDTLMYSTSSVSSMRLLIDYISEHYSGKGRHISLSKQNRLMHIRSTLNLKCSHSIFNDKTRNFELMNNIFAKTGMIDVENRLNDVFKAAWQNANLRTERFYSRLGLYLSISSFLAGLIGFAWAGAVFIDFNSTDLGGYTWARLFYEIFVTAKLHFVLIIAAVPLIIYLIFLFVEWAKRYCISKNLSRFFIRKNLDKEKKMQKLLLKKRKHPKIKVVRRKICQEAKQRSNK